MSDVAVEVNHVWKKFHRGELHDSLRDFVPALARRLVGRGPRRDELADDDFWALQDVSFQVHRGEVLGIIGPNGAGKSTMLKILALILKPNRGHIRVNGQLRALIEIGAGFHGDLTGRENIYLNGSILGMKKREIDRKFDPIVAFSGIEEFLDTPVKRYSSGMQARLGFAVAAHLDPEILVVDEVLAVGDAEFQRRCLGRMSQVAGEGRTVLFVSHNMGAVVELCPRCLLLQEGRVIQEGPSKEVVARYLGHGTVEAYVDLRGWEADRRGPGPLRVAFVKLEKPGGEASSLYRHGEPMVVRVGVDGPAQTPFSMAVSIRNPLGQLILHFSTTEHEGPFRLADDDSEVELHVPNNVLNDGAYFVTVWLGDARDRLNDRVGNCVSFEVNSAVQCRVKTAGYVRIPARWVVQPHHQ